MHSDAHDNFTRTLCYNINRYRHLTQKSRGQLANALGLKEQEVNARLDGVTPFTAWDVHCCAEFFKTSVEMLYPDRGVLRTDILYMLARDLPLDGQQYLLSEATRLARQRAT